MQSIPEPKTRGRARFAPIRRIVSRGVFVLPLALFAAACSGGDDSPSAPAAPPAVASVEVTPATPSFYSGETVQLQATLRDAAGNILIGRVVTWSSNSDSTATVSTSGLVTGIAAGSATITATSEGRSGTAVMSVAAIPVATVAVAPASSSLAVGDSVQLQAILEDGEGNALTERDVVWSSDDESTATVSTSGLVTGVAPGSATITAASEGQAGTADVSVSEVSSGSIVITEISPSVLIEGSSATITGENLQDASVSVNGIPSAVASSTSTTISFTVPIGDCRPTRAATITVQRGEDSASGDATLQPADILEPLSFGDVWMSGFGGEEGHCLHLAGRGSSATYLMGLQSLSPAVSSITPASLRIESSTVPPVLAGGAAPDIPPVLAGGANRDWNRGSVEGRNLEVMPRTDFGLERVLADPEAHHLTEDLANGSVEARAHLNWTERNLELIASMGPRFQLSASTSQTAFAMPPSPGDEISLNVNGGSGACSDFTSITGTVKVTGTAAIWIEDNARPSGGFSDAQYQQLAAMYDEEIAPELETHLGPATDLDQNGRVVILVTPEVNGMEVNGFVWSGDFFEPSSCEGSNNGEYFYVVAPDPDGVTPRTLAVSELLELYPRLLAHEMTHVIHAGQQIFLSGNLGFGPVWEREGLATFVEQLVGHRFTGYGSGQNLGGDVVVANWDWYGSMFMDLALYYGYESQSTRIAAAPHECSWLGRPPNGPCFGSSRLPYGVPASIFRWIADQRWSPATEHQMTRDIVYSTRHGFELLEDLASMETEWIMAIWAIALAADGVYFGGGGPTFTSWDMGDVFGALHATARLTPQPASFDFFDDFDVRGGSLAYFTVSGSHPDLAVAAGNLPSTMRLWIVRVE